MSSGSGEDNCCFGGDIRVCEGTRMRQGRGMVKRSVLEVEEIMIANERYYVGLSTVGR